MLSFIVEFLLKNETYYCSVFLNQVTKNIFQFHRVTFLANKMKIIPAYHELEALEG